MGIETFIWADPASYIRQVQPDLPVCFFAPDVLRNSLKSFQNRFPGLVTYAVKANATPLVLENLVASGLQGFDVASPAEIKQVRDVTKDAVLHYNNPVRSTSEIAFAREHGIKSYSVDSFTELAKLAAGLSVEGVEISVRLKLPLNAASYDFGAKFGATPEKCISLLKEVARLGFTPSMTFHPGTQCKDANAWHSYILAVADVARKAGVRLHRLNVGGGFPSHRGGHVPDLLNIFAVISEATIAAFPINPPSLVCEPGRAMVAEAFTLATRIKGVNDDGDIFLNDGTYGALAELGDIENNDRTTVLSATGVTIGGEMKPRTVFGPTCDSLDVLPDKLLLPETAKEGDYLLFEGMGAYTYALATDFNGYGRLETVSILRS